jgi:predicted amino acid-binding ACT domain protein
MSQPTAKGEPTPGPVTEVLDPALAADKAKSLLKSMRSFLADSDLQSSRIRVAVTIPVAALCLLGWVILYLFGSVFLGGAKHPETMLIAGGVLLLIGLHSWIYRGPSMIATALLAAVIALIYGFAVSVNGVLPTVFMSAVIIALHAVAVPRAALVLSLLSQDSLPEPSRGRTSRRVKSFPITPRITLAPDDRAQLWLLSVSASDRSGLLYAIARVLARHQINLQLAKITTLGERIEDTFLLDGAALSHSRTQIAVETELLDAIAA